eukprot:7328355-Pyramimonas_sp.AAC.1
MKLLRTDPAAKVNDVCHVVRHIFKQVSDAVKMNILSTAAFALSADSSPVRQAMGLQIAKYDAREGQLS